jgi:PAS domain S-box-containing protein
MPGSVIAFVIVLAALAAGTTAAATLTLDHASKRFTPIALGFVPLLVLAEALVLRFRYRDQVDGRNLFEAALAPLIFAYPAVAVVGLVAGAQAIDGILRRNRPVKAAFNVAQWALAAAVGSVVFMSLGAGSLVTPRNLIALVVAVSAVMIVNQAAFTYVIVLARGERLQQVVRGLAPAYVLGLLTQAPVNLTVGLLLASAFEWHETTLVLFPLPLVLLYWAFHSHAIAITERSRATRLRSISRILGQGSAEETIPRFLAQVRLGFDAEVVELVLPEPRNRLIHRVELHDEPVYRVRREPAGEPTLAAALLQCDRPLRVTKDSGDQLAALLTAQGWRDCYAAPLVIDRSIVGVLCVFNRSGFDFVDDDDLAIVEELAGETAAARRNGLLQAIVRDQRRLQDMVARTSDGLIGVSIDGVVRMWNPAFEQITGYSAADMIGTRQVGVLRPRDEAGRDVMIEQWAAFDRTLPETVQIRTRTGEVRWLSCVHTVLPAADGQPSMLVCVARDMTQTREIERLKDEFAATVSHELRIPLTPIKGWAATLLQLGDRVSADQREEGIRRILAQAERLEQIITGLLEMAKIEGGEIHRLEPVDLRAVTKQIVAEFEDEYPDRIVRPSLSTGARPRGNEAWVGQIIRNLLSNAAKYSPPSAPVEIRVSDTAGQVTIAVTDHGAGIPLAQQEQVFERFRRLEQNRSDAAGVGLGLHIASQLARAMNGTLTVESEPGGGATFALTLPAATPLSVAG